MKVSTTKLKNIQDKELYYVTITNNEETKKVNINVGQKTYNAVSELEDTTLKQITQLETNTEKKPLKK